jgi:hypothetical protein
MDGLSATARLLDAGRGGVAIACLERMFETVNVRMRSISESGIVIGGGTLSPDSGE